MKTVLIDSNYLAYRAKFTTGGLSYEGINTGITYGFLNQLFTIVEHNNPDQLIFFWDSRKNKRKEILPIYKQKNRTEEEKKEWEILFEEFNRIKEDILVRMGFVNIFEQEGYESDDLIAEYVFTKDSNEKIIVATGDDDLLQLLDHCSIDNLGKRKRVTRKNFQKKWGITPPQWGMVKQIAGCTSDNVPGIPGVAEKTAAKYLKDELKRTTKTYQKIKDNKELIEFNKQLVVLPFKGTKDVRKDIGTDQFSMRNFLRICREYDFRSFRRETKKDQIRETFLKQT